MTETNKLYSLGDYENFIYTNFIKDSLGDDDHLGLNFSLLIKTFENEMQVDLQGEQLVDIVRLKQQLNSVIEYVDRLRFKNQRPIWYKINVIDQAVNEYVGIGFLNLHSDWVSFIINYLNADRALEGGDTIISIFDINFQFAVCFTLCQDKNILIVEKFEKQNGT